MSARKTTPYASAFETILDSGLGSPLPLPAKRKAPPPDGFTGGGGHAVSEVQARAWAGGEPARVGKSSYKPSNIAIRLAPGVIGIDVDHYDDKTGATTLADLEEKLGALPATFKTSSREGPSGIMLFRVHADVAAQMKSIGPHVDLIRHGHRYAIVAPSIHPSGAVYAWWGPDGEPVDGPPRRKDLPKLPKRWRKHLTGRAQSSTNSPDGASEWAAASPASMKPARWSSDLSAFLEARDVLLGSAELDGHDNRHDLVRDVVYRLANNHATELLSELEEVWIEVMSDRDQRPGGKREARREWSGFVDDLDLDAPLGSPGLDETGGIILDAPELPVSFWGEGDTVLAAKGEPTMLYSATGLGKTTLAQNVVMAAIGIGDSEVLGYPVARAKRILYLAYDRPAQALRSFRRMVKSKHRAKLDERLVIERRRLLKLSPSDRVPDTLLRNYALERGVDLIVIDSLKDIVTGIATDEGGVAYNNAVQYCVAAGVDVITLHHPRKAGNGKDEKRSQLSLDDLYGSTWIKDGQGSVIALDGTPGESTVTLRHLKMPATQVETMLVSIDYTSGKVTGTRERDILTVLRRRTGGIPASGVASSMGLSPSAKTTERVRRRLEKLVSRGLVQRAEETGEKGAVLYEVVDE